MTVVGFHCSHEQIAPSQLLQDVRLAPRESALPQLGVTSVSVPA